MAIPLLSIIIVTRNRRSELHRCLQSLRRLSYPHTEIVLIDNASTDGLPDMVAEEFPDVRLFCADRNYGCGVGRNLGARVARGDYFWFIDDDAEVIVPDAGERLVGKLAAESDVGGIGGEAVVDEMGQVIGVKQLELASNGMTTGRFTLDVAEDSWLPARLLAGCNVMVRRADFIAYGGFDPSYRHGWEDTDFAWRMHLGGRRLLIAGFAPVLHHFSGVERQSSLRTPAQSRAYFVAKNARWPVLLTLPLLDLLYLLNPLRWSRILDKARRVDYGAKGRILQPSGQLSRVGPRQLLGAVKVALNYAATVCGGYTFGWRMFGRGIAARRHAPNGWKAADPIIIDRSVGAIRSIAAAE
ncbi:MAG: glycosyltransferase family 2 protein [Alphaproteobacteria bacterium]